VHERTEGKGEALRCTGEDLRAAEVWKIVSGLVGDDLILSHTCRESLETRNVNFRFKKGPKLL
jgi:hypothetical protein